MLWRKSQHPTTWDYPCFWACKLIARALPPSFLRLGASPLKGQRFSWGTAAFRSGGSRVRWNPSRFSSFCHQCRMQGQAAMWSWQPQETKRLVAKFTELWWLHPTLFVWKVTISYPWEFQFEASGSQIFMIFRVHEIIHWIGPSWWTP